MPAKRGGKGGDLARPRKKDALNRFPPEEFMIQFTIAATTTTTESGDYDSVGDGSSKKEYQKRWGRHRPHMKRNKHHSIVFANREHFIVTVPSISHLLGSGIS